MVQSWFAWRHSTSFMSVYFTPLIVKVPVRVPLIFNQSARVTDFGSGRGFSSVTQEAYEARAGTTEKTLCCRSWSAAARPLAPAEIWAHEFSGS